jgi:hypothetical protein
MSRVRIFVAASLLLSASCAYGAQQKEKIVPSQAPAPTPLERPNGNGATKDHSDEAETNQRLAEYTKWACHRDRGAGDCR